MRFNGKRSCSVYIKGGNRFSGWKWYHFIVSWGTGRQDWSLVVLSCNISSKARMDPQMRMGYQSLSQMRLFCMWPKEADRQRGEWMSSIRKHKKGSFISRLVQTNQEIVSTFPASCSSRRCISNWTFTLRRNYYYYQKCCRSRGAGNE